MRRKNRNQAGYIKLSTIGRGVVAAPNVGAAQDSLGGSATGKALFVAASADAAQDAIGASVTGKAVMVAASQDAAQGAIGATATGKAVLVAVSQAAGRTAIAASADGYQGTLAAKDTNYTHNGASDNGKMIPFAMTANRTLTLPAVAGYSPGQRLCGVKTSGNFLLTIDGNAAETVNGAASQDLSGQIEQTVDIICNDDSTGWLLAG